MDNDVSVGVLTIVTAGTRASFAERAPMIAPPPTTPTTPSAFSFRINNEPLIDAVSDFIAAFNNLILDAAWPPAFGIGEVNHGIFRFLK